MRHKLLVPMIAICAFGLGFAALEASAAAPKPTSCDAPIWPKEALRYELEGSTLTQFDIGADGTVQHAANVRSSGWKILDDAAVRYHEHCRYAPAADGASPRTSIRSEMAWTLEASPTPTVPPVLLPETCSAPDRFSFTPMSRKVTAGEGVLVRLLVSPLGQPFGVQFEDGQDRAAVDAAASFIQSCRFKPATRNGVTGPGNIAGRIAAMAKPQ